ncbi:hypothetical protein B4135_3650 [Caldibacillus debilis]|uniref:Uncharacterized protein n=1 Tax=Caldibacillus debilis TaxID=301148 RepID=A0A150LBA9_9BACI|nr:hypothetical protein B4135_3650 [Caldibacillus debilis]
MGVFLEKYFTFDCLLIFGQPFFSQALISYIRHGHIIGMNILSVKYNELIHLKVKKEDHEEDEKTEPFVGFSFFW